MTTHDPDNVRRIAALVAADAWGTSCMRCGCSLGAHDAEGHRPMDTIDTWCDGFMAPHDEKSTAENDRVISALQCAPMGGVLPGRVHEHWIDQRLPHEGCGMRWAIFNADDTRGELMPGVVAHGGEVQSCDGDRGDGSAEYTDEEAWADAWRAGYTLIKVPDGDGLDGWTVQVLDPVVALHGETVRMRLTPQQIADVARSSGGGILSAELGGGMQPLSDADRLAHARAVLAGLTPNARQAVEICARGEDCDEDDDVLAEFCAAGMLVATADDDGPTHDATPLFDLVAGLVADDDTTGDQEL